METSSRPLEEPIWLFKEKIDEYKFCEELLQEEPMICIHDSFFTVDGRVTDLGKLRNRIHKKISPYIRFSLSRKTSALLDALRDQSYSEPLEICEDRIHVANGTLFLDGRFETDKEFCLNRLPVSYHPDAPKPERWLRFVEELLYPEDIPTLQEYMGYCLIPVTRAQQMLLLVGKGGEGKSRIGVVLSAMLGNNMYCGSIAKLEVSPFARADLEFQLLMVDDDMKMEALPQTNNIKTIVTAETPMDLERKGKQSYQGVMYARLMGFGNGTLKSKYDQSLGFFRRQVILHTKDKAKDRIDDPFLSDKLKREIDGIFLWSLEGLQRLIAQGFHFTVSERAEENLRESMSESNSLIPFLESEGYIAFREDACLTSHRLYELYRKWCDDNAVQPMSSATFCNRMAGQAEEYHLRRSNKIPVGKCEVRGYFGICEVLHLVGTGDSRDGNFEVQQFSPFDEIAMEQSLQATPLGDQRPDSGAVTPLRPPEVSA
jgi:putative DNA primase/helicase